LPYLTPYRIDGIWFDTWGNPTYYDVLQYHPGGVFPMPTWKFDTVPAQYILHLFSQERPGQHRGMPEMISSTDLWADRRSFRKSTVLAAKTAASIALMLETNMPPNGEATRWDLCL
jgi:capsid protein